MSDKVDKLLEHTYTKNIEPSLELNRAVLEKVIAKEKNIRPRNRKKIGYIRKFIAVAACMFICIGSVPAMVAADNKNAYDFLYNLSPSMAQKLKPVNLSCVDNGIELRVVSANQHDNMVTLLISLKGNDEYLLDSTTSLHDSYGIRGLNECTTGCTFVSYDKNANTATFLVQFGVEDIEDWQNEKITFSLNKIMGKMQYFNQPIKEIDLKAVPEISDYAKNTYISGWGVQEEEYFDVNSVQLINPDTATPIMLTKGVEITGYGMLDGKLHVQIRYENIISSDNYGNIYLENHKGNILDCKYTVSFEHDSKYGYQEMIFDVSEEELSEYEMWGVFMLGENKPILGDWQVTFPIQYN